MKTLTSQKLYSSDHESLTHHTDDTKSSVVSKFRLVSISAWYTDNKTSILDNLRNRIRLKSIRLPRTTDPNSVFFINDHFTDNIKHTWSVSSSERQFPKKIDNSDEMHVGIRTVTHAIFVSWIIRTMSCYTKSFEVIYRWLIQHW